MKLKHLIWFLVAAMAYVAILAWGIRTDAKARAIRSELEEMFHAVHPMPGATALDYSAHHEKGTQVLVESTYSGDLRWSAIRKYYDGELRKHGWRFVGENRLRDWGVDAGGRAAHYRNRLYGADLEFAGEKKDAGWTYALSFEWGLH